jgi:hypothetical protein
MKRKLTGFKPVDELLAAGFEGLDARALGGFRSFGRRIAIQNLNCDAKSTANL